VGSEGSRGDSGEAAPATATTLSGIEIGTVLAGKYRIEKLLGEGGMGVVLAAHHLHLDERVAIKFLRPEILQNRDIVGRFLREARAAIKIKSEYVSRVTDVGTLETGAPYMVMEYLDGRDLASWIAERGALSIEQTIEFVLQACEAIAEAHVLKMVHRDLKPANLFVVKRADGLSAVRVLDFGISKMASAIAGGTGLGVTKTSDIMGSPLYMAPEQMLASHDVDMRSDIWSLGVVIHEMITGRVPFDGETIPEVCAKILRDAPEPMSQRNPGVPPGLDRVVLRCLEKERNDRFQNVAELANALVDYGPRRARASAERITRTIEAAGLARQPATEMPASAKANEKLEAPQAAPAAGSAPTEVAQTKPRETKLGDQDLALLRSVGSKQAKVFLYGGAAALAILFAVVGLPKHPSASPPAATSATSAKVPLSPSSLAPVLPSVVPLPSSTPAPVLTNDPATRATSGEMQPSNAPQAPPHKHRKEVPGSHPKPIAQTKAVADSQSSRSAATTKPPNIQSNRLLDLTDDRR
jgi:serine/threonine-protein kinase